MCVNIATTQIITSKCEKLLGIKIESNLHFEDHIGGICKKAGAKLNALTRIANHMPFQKRKVPMNAFFTSEFSYCPLTWMFHSRKPNNNINNTRSLSRHEQVCLIRLLFERYFSHQVSLETQPNYTYLFITWLSYEHWTDKQRYFTYNKINRYIIIDHLPLENSWKRTILFQFTNETCNV